MVLLQARPQIGRDTSIVAFEASKLKAANIGSSSTCAWAVGGQDADRRNLDGCKLAHMPST